MDRGAWWATVHGVAKDLDITKTDTLEKSFKMIVHIPFYEIIYSKFKMKTTT